MTKVIAYIIDDYMELGEIIYKIKRCYCYKYNFNYDNPTNPHSLVDEKELI